MTAAASSAAEARQILATQTIDLLFLDIEMPGINGIDFLKQLPHPPQTIVVTAYPQFAVEGFELDVRDYLVKPVSYSRFIQAVNKLRRVEPGSDDPFVFIKSGSEHIRVRAADIDYIEARGNYLLFHTAHRSLLTYMSLAGALTLLPADSFLKIHKSFIVNLMKVTKVEAGRVHVFNKALPLSRTHKETVLQKIFQRTTQT